MCLRPLWIKALGEVWDIAPMGQWLLGSQILNEGWLPTHKNVRQLKYTSTSQQGGCIQKISIRIVAPNHPKANVGVVLIHQYHQQIIRWREQQLICCINRINKNATTVRRSRNHNYTGKFLAELPPPGKHRNNMCPSGLAVHHPAYETLQKYATGGCPVKTGQDWTKEEIHAAVMRGPHKSYFAEEAIAHFAAKAKEKVASNQARLVC